MRAVQDADLALLVGLVIVRDQNGKAGLFNGKLVLDGLRAFDDPEAEDFASVRHVVDIAVFLVESIRFGSGKAGHDAVHQRGAEGVFLLNPGQEIRAQIPLLSILFHAFFQFFAVVVDQLAGQDEKALSWLIPKGLEASVKKLGELARIACRRTVRKLAGGIVGDAGLRGVAGEEAKLGIFRAF